MSSPGAPTVKFNSKLAAHQHSSKMHSTHKPLGLRASSTGSATRILVSLACFIGLLFLFFRSTSPPAAARYALAEARMIKPDDSLVVKPTTLVGNGLGEVVEVQRGRQPPVTVTVTEHFMWTKVSFAILILLASKLGVLAPSIVMLLWSRNRMHQQQTRPKITLDAQVEEGDATTGNNHSPLAAAASFLSLSNCFSAGLLVGMGALHFIPEGFEGAIELLPSKIATPHNHHHEIGTPLDHRHEFPPPGWLAYVGGTAESATLFFVCVGILIPVIIDRAVNWLTAAPVCSGGEHAHGGVFLDTLDHQESPNKLRSTATTLILLAALLSFHGTTEGIVIGSAIESATIDHASAVIPVITNPLLALIIPMTLHKFFDALVLGIPVAEETKRRLEDSARCDGTPMLSMVALCKSILSKLTVLITTVSTPAILVGTTMVTLYLGDSPSATGVGNTAGAKGMGLQVLSFASKAVGAGTFLYIGIAEIIVSEIRSVLHETKGSASRHVLPKVCSIAAGMFVVVVMGWAFPHEHSS